MAKLAALIDCLSEVLGIPRTAVEAYAKPLRKAGLISSTGRTGPGSPEMTVDDAAHLLEAILCGSTTQAVDKVLYYKQMEYNRYYSDGESETNYKDAGWLIYLSLGNQHVLHDLIKRLIECSSDEWEEPEGFANYLKVILGINYLEKISEEQLGEVGDGLDGDGRYKISLRVEFNNVRPGVVFSPLIYDRLNGNIEMLGYFHYRPSDGGDRKQYGDLQQKSEVNAPTFAALSRIIM